MALGKYDCVGIECACMAFGCVYVYNLGGACGLVMCRSLRRRLYQAFSLYPLHLLQP